MKFKFVSGNSSRDVKVYLDDKDITISCMEVNFKSDPSSIPVVELKLYPESVEIESNVEVNVIKNKKEESKAVNIFIQGSCPQNINAIGKEIASKLKLSGITC